MPLNKNIHKVMIIGSGPIVIGQAAEFDYAGNQACKALKSLGLEVCLVNSNPATLMTDHFMADEIYLEPLTLESLQRIIEKEKPDSLLSTLGGQTGLTLSMELAKSGFLKSHNVQLLGARPETIDKAEDRQMFKDTMEAIDEPCIPSKVVTTYEDAADFVHNVIGFPAIIRPAFTLGGTGGGIVNNDRELDEIAHNGLHRSPIHQILVEKCISGWKEVEFEVMRDSTGNVITVCSMENFDPVGVHTGDSIVIAPTVTLADKEYQMLRSAALNIISALEIEGGCNCQFALNPDSFEYAVIEVNPRVSRSSALASKATGYPIAKVAALIAVGFTLDEIPNFVTKKTKACFEPVLDYVVVKMPKFPFDKFVYAARKLGTQMKATGEVMAIGQNFEEAILKAARGLEVGVKDLNLPAFVKESDEKIRERVTKCTDQRIFAIYQALKRNLLTVEEIHEITKIDEWFLWKLEKICNAEKAAGEKMLFQPKSFKMVDTCAGEFDAETPYFYSTTSGENEAETFLNERKRSSKGTIVVLGSGPIRIGQGIEFDYASVQCVRALKKLGYEVAIVNNNPETVSTDFDTADRLYFEPLTPVDVMNVLAVEKPLGVVVAFGGGTAIKLAKFLDEQGIKILGTSADAIDLAEDRERFEELCDRLQIKRPKGMTVFTEVEALETAEKITYPVLMRPSYVLGGQNMIVARNSADVKEYMAIILRQKIENPVLIDKYMEGKELEVDCICDGENVLIPGIMEHIERTGIHSGDSIAVYPGEFESDIESKIVKQSVDLALALGTKGLVNIQYLIYENDLYIIEANPRSSRTVPYISKVSGIPMIDLATRAMLGEKVSEMGYGTGLYRKPNYFAVKVPVFSFEKLMDVDTHLGPEMKSTGEVLGIASTRNEAVFKGMAAAGWKSLKTGGVLFSVRQSDLPELPSLARKFYDLGFKLYATSGNAATIERSGMEVEYVAKVHENYNDNVMTLLESGKVVYVVSTSAKGRDPVAESVKLRRLAVERDIDCLTAIDTANALADCLASPYTLGNASLVDINHDL
ncbi:carbamoyl-phosphate synthase large subunit [Treponema ruminis]|uniref:Carbamoyl-phosphate synthase large subunit n=1 Tax=Treponema ruminis TaxID=744515 RepID=A0A7W8LLI0_9SPIR|nr:carbamoyl-phosphate synthase large subunit [Treponema ruminis]MBB5225466.1 carbamoyl-phosphate synthase large subunit [Treponema ruminis]QSI01665.1 carbamoyl-phosphate synthase large subunit [Treponema ruminis]